MTRTSKKKPTPTGELVERLKQDLADLIKRTGEGLTNHARRSLDAEVREVMSRLGKLLHEIDPIRQPAAVFDPSNPKVIGRFTALALVAQPRQPLGRIERFYGSGVYAIYYRGPFAAYAPLSRSETPIYVGQAAPEMSNARLPIEQGDRLSGRLDEHRKNIGKAESTLAIDDFDYRVLVVQSGWETPAEDYLIHMFRPIWNKETNILFGIGKHGDAATTRKNRRSPWDTLHPARKWASASAPLTDARAPEQIADDLQRHFAETRVFNSIDEVLSEFIAELRQI
jgi:hypothetical protein